MVLAQTHTHTPTHAHDVSYSIINLIKLKEPLINFGRAPGDRAPN